LTRRREPVAGPGGKPGAESTPRPAEGPALDWDTYFMSLAYLVAMKSKDPRTKVGAVVVGPDNEIRTTGYNSFPRGLEDAVPERQVSPAKHLFFEHAERNAIYNAARMGTSLKGCRIYLPFMPCSDCARGIVQAGLAEVVLHREHPGNDAARFEAEHHHAASRAIFEECGIGVRYWSGRIPRLAARFDDEPVPIHGAVAPS
jgi:dCMP deaminase